MLYVEEKLKTRKYFSIFAALMIYKRNRYEENNNIRHRYGGCYLVVPSR